MLILQNLWELSMNNKKIKILSGFFIKEIHTIIVLSLEVMKIKESIVITLEF